MFVNRINNLYCRSCLVGADVYYYRGIRFFITSSDMSFLVGIKKHFNTNLIE